MIGQVFLNKTSHRSPNRRDNERLVTSTPMSFAQLVKMLVLAFGLLTTSSLSAYRTVVASHRPSLQSYPDGERELAVRFRARSLGGEREREVEISLPTSYSQEVKMFGRAKERAGTPALSSLLHLQRKRR
jgi:hypothetical protein